MGRYAPARLWDGALRRVSVGGDQAAQGDAAERIQARQHRIQDAAATFSK
jgi:hypothetical protein